MFQESKASPSNPSAEISLVATLLMHNRAFDQVADFLRAEHFYDTALAKVFTVIQQTILDGKQANPVTLHEHPVIKELGGKGFLAGIASHAITTANTAEYGKLVFELFQRRELIRIGENLIYDAAQSADDARESAERELFELTSHDTGGLASLDVALDGAIKLAEAAHKRQGLLNGVTTGLRDLDELLGGLHDSDLIILAGRPSQGKTSLGLTIAYNAARSFKDKTVAFFSLEMDKESLATRILSEEADLSGHQLRTGRVESADFSRVYTAKEKLTGLPLQIDDTPAPTVMAIRTRCRRLARTKGLGLVVIDYLQLITPSKAENRVQEVSGITRGLKALSKDLGVPVIALSQLSRKVEDRDDRRPQLSDLRESGTIEQDSDVVMAVYREEYYLAREEPDAEDPKHVEWGNRMAQAKNTGEVIVLKQRHGPIGSVDTFFDPEKTWFRDLRKY